MNEAFLRWNGKHVARDPESVVRTLGRVWTGAAALGGAWQVD